ncbi:glycosyltransferase family 4 protein [Halorubrum ezzemoulense]|uniref:glycosyltransferase family 4 protein n=1 Tax=Halorubrum ezzemoulense TaxID=337243 RepID=UPI002330ECEF|nr:glycosyltransferase family 4 protein [Halorubrum ezzemoulense]MDB9281521.1 glycosyltransferase family 4 protein [Halorubrum ezzemoulense]MDB9285051.1 glycosyltransferase family 4 protein [Halorubrum ezzemoulense]
MRILRVAPWIYPDTKGGGDYHVHAMSRDQAAMGHDVTVLTTREDESLPRIEETHGYTILRVSPGVTLLGNDVSSAVARYLWHADSEDFDVIHAHSHCYFVTNLAALKRRLGDIPLAITNHGLYSQNAPERLFSLYLKTLGRWTFNQADVVFCYTDVDKQRVRDLGVSSRIEVVSNGIDTERFTPEGPESELIDAEGPVVLFVGRFAEGKRPWLAIEAFAEVLAEYPDAELYLCGDGALREELEAQVAELGIGEAVTFLGHVPYDEMPKVYRSGDVLVLPSRAEGVPRTVLEAMASGLEIVMSDLDQVSPILGKSGVTVSVENPEGFADGLETVLNSGMADPQIQIEGQFDWTNTVERATAILDEL